jgi:hypothetical protein
VLCPALVTLQAADCATLADPARVAHLLRPLQAKRARDVLVAKPSRFLPFIEYDAADLAPVLVPAPRGTAAAWRAASPRDDQQLERLDGERGGGVPREDRRRRAWALPGAAEGRVGDLARHAHAARQVQPHVARRARVGERRRGGAADGAALGPTQSLVRRTEECLELSGRHELARRHARALRLVLAPRAGAFGRADGRWTIEFDMASLGAWCRILAFNGPLTPTLAAAYAAAAGGPPAEVSEVANFRSRQKSLITSGSAGH